MIDYARSGTMGASLKRAKELGLEIVLSAPDELLIDIDNESDYVVFVENSTILKKYIDVWHSKPSKSGLPKRHIHVRLTHTIDAQERIMLQAILGSDRKHEAYSFLALCEGHTNPTMFFEKPRENNE